MPGLYFLFPTLLIILVSFLLVRAAAIGLMMTGLDEKKARFQALSAFTGTGFTTREAETVVNNPVRRRIVSWLMILGNAGIVSLIVTTTSSFIGGKGSDIAINVLVLSAGLYLIYKFITRKGLIRRWEDFVHEKFVQSGAFEEGITEDLVHLIEGYGMVRATMTENSPFVGKTLGENKMTLKKLLVFGIERGGKWISAPSSKELIQPGDKIVVYGPLEVLRTHMKSK